MFVTGVILQLFLCGGPKKVEVEQPVESLGEILKRLAQQNTFGDSVSQDLLPDEDGNGPPECPICADLLWVRRDVATSHQDFGKAFACVCQQELGTEQRLSRLRRFSNMGVLSEVDFATSTSHGPGFTSDSQGRFHAAFQKAVEFAANPTGFFILVGGSGTGKTHLAAAIANSCMATGVPVFFAFVPDLLDHLRSAYDPERELSYVELFDQVRTIPMLVLDDLGTHAGTPWAQEKLYQVLNARSLNGLPTVITSSVAVERLDGRIQSRLMDPRGSQVADLGGSTRAGTLRVGAIEPAMLKSMTLDSFYPQGAAQTREGRVTLENALLFARNFADTPEGWLVLTGEHGCGKTHLAIAIANERISLGEEVFFAFVPDLLDHLRYTFSPDSRVTYDELFDQVKQTSLLILDDLGSQTSTAWASEKLYQIIVHRHNARLSTIITTKDLRSGSEDPIASRLGDSAFVTVLPITAPDYRLRNQSPRKNRQGDSR